MLEIIIGAFVALLALAGGLFVRGNHHKKMREVSEDNERLAREQLGHRDRVDDRLAEVRQEQREREADRVEERKETGRRELGTRWPD